MSGPIEYRTKVKLVLEDVSTEWIVGAVVCLYDRDRLSRDDLLGSEVSDRYGEATFHFTSDAFFDLDDRLGGGLPELFVEVFDSDGTRVLSTRAEARPNAVPELIRVPVPRALADQHRLL